MSIDLNKPFKQNLEGGFSLYHSTSSITYGNPVTNEEVNKVSPYIAYNYRLVLNNGYSTEYNYDITNNCQIASFRSFEGILGSSERLKAMKWLYKELVLVGVMKRQILIDVRDKYDYPNKVREMFKDFIVFEQPYLSTNGSNMVMFLVKSEALK